MNLQQRQSVDTCIKALVDIAKLKGIAVPADVESQVTALFGRNALIAKQSAAWLSAARVGSPAAGHRPRPPHLDISPSRLSAGGLSAGYGSSAGGLSAGQVSTPVPHPTSGLKSDRSIIEGLHDIVSLLEQQLKPLVQAELSVLVDILYRPEKLFPVNTEARIKTSAGGFICKLINHTERLLEEKEDKLCVKVLQTLKQMMAVDPDYDNKVINFMIN